jgi:hypothetical protein
LYKTTTKPITPMMPRRLLPRTLKALPIAIPAAEEHRRIKDSPAPYLRICHKTMDNQVRAAKAIETIITLNLRIRISYFRAQLSCCSIADVRFAVQTNPLVFTYYLF